MIFFLKYHFPRHISVFPFIALLRSHLNTTPRTPKLDTENKSFVHFLINLSVWLERNKQNFLNMFPFTGLLCS